MISSTIITEIRRQEQEERLVRECDALDQALAEAFAFDEANMSTDPDDEDLADEYAEVRKAALSRGQP